MAGPSSKDVTIIDGSLDFSGGVNSYVVPTIQSERNPNGLKRNQVAWMSNATVRGGGITQRAGFEKLGNLPAAATGLYQGGWMYETDYEEPYLILSIGGHIWKIDVDDPSNAVDLSSKFFTQGATAVTAISDQVVVVMTHMDVTGAGVVQPAGTDPVIGAYQSFMAPAVGNQVRVATSFPYTGALLATLTIGGSQYRIDAVAGFTVGTSTVSPLINPPLEPKSYFCQAEEFLIIQAGDNVTLPLIWDGVTLRRSLGLTGGGTGPSRPNLYGIYIPATYPPPAPFFGLPAYAFNIPAYLGTSTFTLSTPYTGNVGDYIALPTGETIQNGMLANYAYFDLLGWITAIGASDITVQWFYKADWLSWNSWYISGGGYIKIVRPTIVTITPSTGSNIVVGNPEIPPATAMDYYMGRLWYAQDRQYSAGDIVGGSSGSLGYDFRDAVLKITENPLAIGGDGFTVPTNDGNIRAIRHSANINTQLGEGQLFIFTRTAVYQLTVPVTRTDWIGADTNNQPRQTVVQVTNGAVNDRSVVEQNGDLFFQSFEPSIRSLIMAIRNYSEWGNTPISINENRIIGLNDRGLLKFASGISFNNRMLQTALPVETPVGVAHQAIVPLNFDVVSTMETKLPPVWEGSWEGLLALELFKGDFGGLDRAIVPIYSERERRIQLWEITTANRFEADDKRVLWFVEFPAFTWGDEFAMKKLVSAELWLDRIFGEVMFSMDYRPDGDPCWYKWVEWKRCTARNEAEDSSAPQYVYPSEYCESYRQTEILPIPPISCASVMARPTNIGFQFQCRLTIKGFCRIRGLLLKAEKVEQQLYGSDMVC